MFCVNTLTSQSSIYLPPAIIYPGGNITVKDIGGNAKEHNINIYTTGADSFEYPGNTFVRYAIMNSNYGAVTFTSDGVSCWMITQHLTQNFALFFTPLKLSGLYVWIDAAQMNVAVGSYYQFFSALPNLGYGGPVSATNVLTFEGTSAPWALNNLPTFLFYQYYSTWGPVVFTGNSYSLFYVARMAPFGNRGRGICGVSYNQLYAYWNGYKNQLYLDGNPGYLGGPASDFTWDIWSHTRTTGGAYTFSWNGSLQYSGATSDTNPSSEFTINTGSGQNEQSYLNVAEILIYDRVLSSDEVAKIEGYLAWKWNLNYLLPSNHPYYSGKP
jgi:hypothetical protein